MSLSTANLHPDFAKRVEQLLRVAEANRWGITLVSALRTHREQLALYRRLKPLGLPVATPGRSCHEFGVAIDVACRFGFKSQQFGSFTRAAQLLNVTNPVANDPGHFQDTRLCNELRSGERVPIRAAARKRRTGVTPGRSPTPADKRPAPDRRCSSVQPPQFSTKR